MVVLRAKGTQKSSKNIILQAAAYDAVKKIKIIHIQDMKIECMVILNKNKVRLLNYETSMRNPDYSLIIYLTADKIAQFTIADENRR